MPDFVWIIIVAVVVLIALYIVYLVASNRRFHRMVDPQLDKLRQYEKARHEAAHKTLDQDAEEDYPAWKQEK